MCTSYTSNTTYSFKRKVAESKREREKNVRTGSRIAFLIVTHSFILLAIIKMIYIKKKP